MSSNPHNIPNCPECNSEVTQLTCTNCGRTHPLNGEICIYCQNPIKVIICDNCGHERKNPLWDPAIPHSRNLDSKGTSIWIKIAGIIFILSFLLLILWYLL
ncbi:MAG: hypothetical protein GF308_00330 [Candidatus Heimdallarchaeota archaeon]|nr:hypothetical protein [Candidatus Heimdallarchaeota archaeon]